MPLKERTDTSAAHLRSIGDLSLAANSIYACIDVYDLFRRVVNLVGSLHVIYAYLTVLHITLSDPQMAKRVQAFWQNPLTQVKLRSVPYRTVVGLLTNPETVPKWSCRNYQIILQFMEQSQDTSFNENLLLVLGDVDFSPQVIPVEETPVTPTMKSFKIRCFPQTIDWNRKAPKNIKDIHRKLSKHLLEDDFDVLADEYIWRRSNVELSASMSLIDIVSAVLTGYTYYTGTLLKGTSARFAGDRPTYYKDVNDSENWNDLSYENAQMLLSNLKMTMASKLKEIDE